MSDNDDRAAAEGNVTSAVSYYVLLGRDEGDSDLVQLRPWQQTVVSRPNERIISIVSTPQLVRIVSSLSGAAVTEGCSVDSG